MSNFGQINKLKCDFQDKGLPASLCPYIGENFADHQILIVSEAAFLKKDVNQNTANTPFESPSLFYKGESKFLDQKQEEEISVRTFVERLRPFLTSGYSKSINYDDIKLSSDAVSPTTQLSEKMLYTLSRARASIDDIAVHHFFLRPCVFDEESEITNYDELIEKYFTEEDKIHSIKMLRNVIDTLCPQKVYFSSTKTANIVSETFIKIYSKPLGQFFAERQILTDLESPWDSDKKRLDRLLKGNTHTTGQKRLRLLTTALIDIEENLRKKSTEPRDELNDLRAVIDNIKAIVSKHEDNLKNCGKIDNLKIYLPDEQMKERIRKAAERMAKARESRWPNSKKIILGRLEPPVR